MRSVYPGFYSISDEVLQEIWSADTTLFVFDTNCLLNLYRCEDHTREEILKVMKAIAHRIWIPFQVGFEYQRSRRSIISDSITSLRKIQQGLQNICNDNILSHGSVKKHLYNSLSNEALELQLQLKEPIESFINEKITPRIESKVMISTHDFIRDEVDSIVSDNVGALPTQDDIDAINREGELRYEKRIPPGFKDGAKKDISFFSGIYFQDKYADLYLWKEIINKAKSEQIKSVIFVCDDAKEDWWFIHSGETHGPLEALKTEICKEASIDNFKLVSQSTFLHDAKTYLDDIKVSESSLIEVEGLSKNNITKESDDIYFGDHLEEKLDSISDIYRDYKSSFYINNKNIENFLSPAPKDLDSSIEMNISLLDAYEVIATRAKRVLAELQEKRVILVDIVGPDKYLNCKRELNVALRSASEIADNVKYRMDIIMKSETKVDIISHLTESLHSKILRLNNWVDKARGILSNIS